ncbi:Uncharacterised protein [Actinobacillus equuli]|nr:Uncharacterised protein [Actinobacillus equuli]
MNSIVHDYSNSEAREALLAKLKQQGSNAPAACSNTKIQLAIKRWQEAVS